MDAKDKPRFKLRLASTRNSPVPEDTAVSVLFANHEKASNPKLLASQWDWVTGKPYEYRIIGYAINYKYAQK